MVPLTLETATIRLYGPRRMDKPSTKHDLLKEIPSPSARLWAGLCIILSTFIVFAGYTIHEIRWLEDFQVNVVQKNRKASIQLERLQSDAYLLAISMRDMASGESRYPIMDWRAEFDRLRADMVNASAEESRYAVSTPASADKRGQLRSALERFHQTADHVFDLAQSGYEDDARSLVRTDLESERAEISEIVARLMTLNDRAQSQAAATISAVYGSVKRDVFGVIVALFLLALGTGLYTLEANQKTFMRLHDLAEKLQTQSEKLRRMTWKLIVLQEETLRQVARDLHDEFGQILTATGIMLGRANPKTTDPELIREFQTVKNLVEETLRNVRDRSQMFRPAILDDFGLDQTLEWFTTQFSRQTGIQVHFEGKIGVFPSEEAIHVYRIVQEALSNVARHSKAGEAWVKVGAQDGELRLEIRDLGSGFDQAAAMKRGAGQGIGLMGMQERAQRLNGSLEVRSARGDGTTVSVRIPIERTPLEPLAQKVG